jgi:hypothetical protein
MTYEEKRLAKNAAWRAAQGLPPKDANVRKRNVASWLAQNRKAQAAYDRRQAAIHRVTDHVDGFDRDDLGLSPDF